MRTSSIISILACAALLAACEDMNRLPDASVENTVDTITIGALETPLSTPSAYSVSESRTIRLEQGLAFDFAYDTVDGASRFYPAAALGAGGGGTQAGFILSDQDFESLLSAPQNGYVTDEPVAATSGLVYAIRSRLVCGGLGGFPMYGKLEVLELDAAAGTITFQVLTNNNCGYRSLAPGVPEE